MSVIIAKLRQSRAARIAGGAVIGLIALDAIATVVTLAVGASWLRK
jgi:hypothetical protein